MASEPSLKVAVKDLAFAVPPGCSRVSVSPKKTWFPQEVGGPMRQVDSPLLVFRTITGLVICIGVEAKESTGDSVASLLGKAPRGETIWVGTGKASRLQVYRMDMVFTARPPAPAVVKVVALDNHCHFVPYESRGGLKHEVESLAGRLARDLVGANAWRDEFAAMNPEFGNPDD